MQKLYIILCLSALTGISFANAPSRAIPLISPAQILSYTGQQVRMRMEIRQVGHDATDTMLELYSKPRWETPGCVFIRLTPKVQADAEHWLGKDLRSSLIGRTVEVRGIADKLEFGDHTNTPPFGLIMVSSPDQIHVMPLEFTTRKMHGFTIRVSQRLQYWNWTLVQETLAVIDKNLVEIEKLVRPDIVEQFRKVPITLRFRWMRSPAEYDWRDNCDFNNPANPSPGISIGNLSMFVRVNKTDEQHFVLLHEFAHSYHNRVLGGNSCKIINDAYQHAMSADIYDKVQRKNEPDQPAYAKTDAREYFCELTEAWFGNNDFYPFNREQLKKHDPQGYQMEKSIWTAPPPATPRPEH